LFSSIATATASGIVSVPGVEVTGREFEVGRLTATIAKKRTGGYIF